MKLINEWRGIRLWRLDDGSYHEQRAMVRMMRAEYGATLADKYPEVAEQAHRMLVENLTRTIEREGLEPHGDITLTVERREHWIYLTDEDGNTLFDKDDEPIVDPDFPEPIPYMVATAETGVWPTLPEEA
jgi:hypothetical protein